MRYLLIVMGLVSVLSIRAQLLAQQPEAVMQSTSVMVGSGSRLPSAAANGTIVTGSTLGSYSPAKTPTGPRRTETNPGGGFNSDDNDNDRDEPWKDPLGDALLPLALLACAYLIIRARRRKRA